MTVLLVEVEVVVNTTQVNSAFRHLLVNSEVISTIHLRAAKKQTHFTAVTKEEILSVSEGAVPRKLIQKMAAKFCLTVFNGKLFIGQTS